MKWVIVCLFVPVILPRKAHFSFSNHKATLSFHLLISLFVLGQALYPDLQTAQQALKHLFWLCCSVTFLSFKHRCLWASSHCLLLQLGRVPRSVGNAQCSVVLETAVVFLSVWQWIWCHSFNPTDHRDTAGTCILSYILGTVGSSEVVKYALI